MPKSVGMPRRQFLKMTGVASIALPSLASILAACSPAETEGPDDPAAAPTATEDEATESPGSSEVSVLTFAAESLEAEQFEPRLMNTRADAAYGFLLYDTLWWVDADGQLTPGVAESYEVSDDGLAWTFTLRSMQFHDGSPVTAEDVVFALEQMMSDESNATNRSSWVAVGAAGEALDERTVVIRLERPFADLLVAATPSVAGETNLFPKAYYEGVGEEGFREAPVGTGPWRFVSRTPGERFEFEAVKDHPWRAPSFDALTLRHVPEESTRVASLVTGEIDAALVTFDSIPQLESEGIQIVTLPDVRQAWLMFFGIWDPRIEGMPTGDVRVREALSIAVNTDELIDTLWAGLARRAVGDVERLAPLYGEWERPAVPYDPDRSLQLLSEAGYADGFDIRIISTAAPGRHWAPVMAEAMASYWEAIGVTAEILPVDGGTLADMTSEEELHPDIIGAVQPSGAGGIPASLALPRLMRTDTGFRTTLDSEVHRLMGEGLEAQDEETRNALIREAAARMYDLWVVPVLAWIPAALALGPRVARFEGSAFGDSMSTWPDRMVQDA